MPSASPRNYLLVTSQLSGIGNRLAPASLLRFSSLRYEAKFSTSALVLQPAYIQLHPALLAGLKCLSSSSTVSARDQLTLGSSKLY